MSEPTTLQQHKDVVKTLQSLLDALPVDAVKSPDIPIDHFLDEGFTAQAASEQYADALKAVGMPPDLPAALAARLGVLRSAQALWNAEQRKGRAPGTVVLIERLERNRHETLIAGDLACRHSTEALARLSRIREGDGLPDLIQDGVDCAVLLTDARPLFEAINFNVDAMAAQLSGDAKALQDALAKEDAVRTLTGSKDIRDRVYTLVLGPLGDLRMFAAYAFRNDRNNTRRNAFTSGYVRRKNGKRKSVAVVTDVSVPA
ncbi:MAG: hypothetical protein HY904_23675 [Deltaproteobacteria bacterium]|nr:hypothetical protein [Deltaproteobacteria bacterium]